jgi:cytochrome b pre-mRNA-processing protein 3
MFLFNKRDSGRRKTIERLYGAIVAQARQPVFYAHLGVPDTVEGRFDLLVLHMHLVNERLSKEGEAGAALGQALLDHFFEDMDASLREIGVGDLTVPKKMRTLAEAYLGRSATYGAAIAKKDKAALAGSIARNILAGADANAGEPLARYALDAASNLEAQPSGKLLAAEIVFPVPLKATADAS